jgi:ribonucleotide reductase alpha subunit
MSERFHVVKRSGAHEEIDFNKITQRIAREAVGLSQHIDPAGIAAKVIAGMRPGITTVQLDQLAAETCAALITRHPDFGVLAARLAVTSLYKRTRERFSDVVEALAGCVSHGRPAPLITEHVLAFVRRNAAALDAAVAAGHARDSDYDYFGYRTLERSYLLKLGDAIAERPQHMLMRVAVGIHAHEDDLAAALETYDLISRGLFTHASPTLFNAGTPSAQLASCFLLQIGADSIEGIYDALKECALISKGAGGIGLSVHAVRARGTYIAGTNGESNGLVPMLRVFNNTARYVDQGGGKRKGAFAIYLEPWHADIYEFVDLPRPVGSEDLRARDLFYALWIPDLFMQRVESDGVWSLMCPHECPGLNTCHGDAFRELYEGYEAAGRFQRQVKARHLWAHIISAQIESGRPYMLYKDAANAKSNHQHLGTIQSSNLCTEIVEFTSPDEIAVCNLASIAMPRHRH